MKKLAIAAALLLVVACSKSDSPPQASAGKINAIVASYDLAQGKPTRFLVGLLTLENEPIAGGTVEMSFAFLGESDASAKPSPGPRARGTFLEIPAAHAATPHAHASGTAHELPEGFGVYSATLTFPRAGFWSVTTKTEDSRSGTATFRVLDRHRVPAPGDDAPRSENLTADSPGVHASAVDSRAGEGPVPDPELHSTTVRAALEMGRPVLLIVSTPAYCQSRFCGPVTDMVSDLSRAHSNKASFIHIEVWRDVNTNEINRAAGEWVFRDGDLQEPWVFLIGADGKIVARWDNVATRGEVEPYLAKLPAL